jgi:hypothetical protein
MQESQCVLGALLQMETYYWKTLNHSPFLHGKLGIIFIYLGSKKKKKRTCTIHIEEKTYRWWMLVAFAWFIELSHDFTLFLLDQRLSISSSQHFARWTDICPLFTVNIIFVLSFSYSNNVTIKKKSGCQGNKSGEWVPLPSQLSSLE